MEVCTLATAIRHLAFRNGSPTETFFDEHGQTRDGWGCANSGTVAGQGTCTSLI